MTSPDTRPYYLIAKHHRLLFAMALHLNDRALADRVSPSYLGGFDLDPQCRLDLIDLPETGTVDWDSRGFRCREPFCTSTRMARQKSRAKASTKASCPPTPSPCRGMEKT